MLWDLFCIERPGCCKKWVILLLDNWDVFKMEGSTALGIELLGITKLQ